MNAQLISIIVLLCLSALFSATETAYTSLSFLQLKALESRKGKSSRLVFTLPRNRDAQLTAVLVGNKIVNLSACALTITYASALFGNTAVGWATGALTLAILVFGEITQKKCPLLHSTKIAIFMAWPLRVVSLVLFPLDWMLRHLSGATTRLFATNTEPDVTHEGMRLMVDVAEDVVLVDQ